MVNPITLIYNNKLGLPPLPPPQAFAGKNILITGASSGLGLESAIHFVNLGATTVTITARSLAKGLLAMKTIETATNTVGKSFVKVRVLDMSTIASTKLFVDELKKEVKEMDIVVLNAGVYEAKYGKAMNSEWEQTIQVNVLSTTLLAILLLPWLKTIGGGKAHLAIVTSGLHKGVRIDSPKWPQENVLQYWNQEEKWPKSPDMYSVSKLLLQYAAREVAKLSVGRDGRPEVIVNPICPGMVKTDLARNYKTNFLITILINVIMALIMKTGEGGARSVLYSVLTTASENGNYITHYQSNEDYEKAVEHNVLSEEGGKMQERVWREIVEVLGKEVPEVKEIVG